MTHTNKESYGAVITAIALMVIAIAASITGMNSHGDIRVAAAVVMAVALIGHIIVLNFSVRNR